MVDAARIIHHVAVVIGYGVLIPAGLLAMLYLALQIADYIYDLLLKMWKLHSIFWEFCRRYREFNRFQEVTEGQRKASAAIVEWNDSLQDVIKRADMVLAEIDWELLIQEYKSYDSSLVAALYAIGNAREVLAEAISDEEGEGDGD